MNLFADHCPGGFRRQHPHRNLQPPPGLVNDGDRTISPLRPAHDLKGRTTEWVKTVEDVDVRGFCTQGTAGVGVFIRISIASSLVAGSHPTATVGSPAAPASSCPCVCSHACFAAYFWSSWRRPSMTTNCISFPRSTNFRTPLPSRLISL